MHWSKIPQFHCKSRRFHHEGHEGHGSEKSREPVGAHELAAVVVDQCGIIVILKVS